MKKPVKIQGKIWLIKDNKENFIDDIDTDMIFHNAHLAITDIDKMGQFAFGNLEGWEDFSQKAEQGDILIVGKNFGAGSSRQQAVDCFSSLGICLIIGESFGAIYKRNAINSGFPILESSDIEKINLPERMNVEVNLENGNVTDPSTGKLLYSTKPFSKVQMDIYQSGNLFSFGKSAVSEG